MSSQVWNAQQYRDNASFVAEFGSAVLDLLNPQPDESILDVGCGDGTLTEKIAAVAQLVVCIDASPSMVQAAKDRGLNAILMRGDDLTFDNAFDAVFTNAALHWITQYDAVIKGVYKALKPSGRFVGEFGGKGNIEQLILAMKTVIETNQNMGAFHNPWYFPDADEYQSALEKHGFSVTYIELIPRPTPLKTGVQEWLKIFANHIISGMNPEQEEYFLKETEKRVKPSLYSEASGWNADYVRLRFHAIKA